MKALRPLDVFFLRAPLLPVAVWARLGRSAGLEEKARIVREALEDPAVTAAILLASPALYARLSAIGEGEIPADVVESVARYVARMTTRTAPFGLFATVSLGRVGDETQLHIGPRASIRTHARLDHSALASIVEGLVRDLQVRERATFAVNPTLRVAGERATVVVSTTEGWNELGLEPDEAFTIVTATAHGTIASHVAALVEAGFDEQASIEFVHSLVDDGVLLPSFALSVLGDDPLQVLVRDLQGLQAGAAAVDRALDAARVVREQLSAAEQRLEASSIAGVGATLQSLLGRALDGPAVQVDAVRDSPSLMLGRDLAGRLARAADALSRVSGATEDSAFADLRRDFADRFGDAAVPLLQVFDDVDGIRFRDVPQIDTGVAYRMPGGRAEVERQWSARDAWLAERSFDVKDALVLDDRDVATLESFQKRPRSPVDKAALFRVLPGSFGLEAHLSVLFEGFLGVECFARYAGWDPALRRESEHLLRRQMEREPDVAFAELAFQPSARFVNIVQRPIMQRPWYLPLGARSTEGDPIELGDVFVILDDSGQFRLFSRRLGREVRPVGTVNYDFGTRRNTPLLRFLGQVARGGWPPVNGWRWGSVAYARPALPRVVYRNILLSPASWTLSASGLAARAGDLERYLADRGVPSEVTIAEADRHLPIDLRTIEARDRVKRELGHRGRLQLTELLFDSDREPLRSNDGAYVNEIVLPLERAPVEPRPSPPVRTSWMSRVSRLEQRLYPGAQWAFLKLYTSAPGLDHVVGPALVALLPRLPTCRWFFIRYADPELHIRLRFAVTGNDASGELRAAVESWVAALGAACRIRRACWDTYDREVARYGGDDVFERVESFFCDDSLFAHVSRVRSCTCAHLSPAIASAVASSCTLLDALGLGLQASIEEVLGPMHEMRLREAAATGGTRAFLTRFSRENAAMLRSIAAKGGHDEGCELRADQERWATAASRLGSDLAEAASRRVLSQPLSAIVQSILHMHANRVVIGHPRDEELPLYDCALRVLRQRAARARVD